MAKTPEAVYELLNKIWTPALAAAKKELADMSAIAASEGITTPLESSDWRFYFEKSMAKKFNLNDSELRPYFKLENVREGIFYVANQLYGITFTQVNNVFPAQKQQHLSAKMPTDLTLESCLWICLPALVKKEVEHGAAVSVHNHIKTVKKLLLL